MLFNIEHDGGDCVVGYVVPDGFAGLTRIRVSSGGETLHETETSDPRPSLVAAGRHDTGLCGYVLDESKIPGLAQMADLEIRDAESGLLLYRRPRPEQTRKKVLRIESSLLPLSWIDASVADSFQYVMTRIEQYGRETTTQMFVMNHIDSVYISGNVFYKAFEPFINTGFEAIVVIQDPHEDLAERLLVLRATRKMRQSLLDAREIMRLTPAIDFAEGLPLDDAKAMAREIRDMPRPVAATLADVQTRQLTCAGADEMAHSLAVAGALDVLANCKAVCLREDENSLAEAIGAVVGLSPAAIDIPPKLSLVPKVAAMFRDTGCADFLLEKDLELHHYVAAAARQSEQAAANVDVEAR
jgi:hypothetical protein